MQATKINYSVLNKATKEFYSLSEFADLLSCSIEYVRQMCRKQKDSRGYLTQLPEGWTARKNPETHMWEIFKIKTENTPMVEPVITQKSFNNTSNIDNLMIKVARLEGYKEAVELFIQNMGFRA